MDRIDELATIERAIEDTEARLRALRLSIQDIDLEIKKMSRLEKTLTDNIKMLRFHQIVAIAKEFRKIKEELKMTKTRLSTLQNDRSYYEKMQQDITYFLKNMQERYDKIYNSASNNVLEFRRKDGKK